MSNGDDLHASNFVSSDAEVPQIPMSIIHRPLASVLDQDKVSHFKDLLQKGKDLTPVEILWVEQPQGQYYFAFGGCHRWAAHKDLQSAIIPAKLIRTTHSTLLALWEGTLFVTVRRTHECRHMSAEAGGHQHTA